MTYFVRSATVRLGDTLALDDVTLEVEPGTVVAVVGADGAGKTTLLRSLVGELRLDSGEVCSPAARSIGYLPATAGSWAALTVEENMGFVGAVYGLSGGVLRSRRTALLERASLERASGRLASDLSGGMRRKLGFSMTMLHEPSLLVLDEPSTGIDPVSRVEVWRMVSEAAAAGAAVVLSTTYLDEAERAGSLLALDGGRMLAHGTVDDVLGSFQGVMARTLNPRHRSWSWRRGRGYHEYWSSRDQLPSDATEVAPDLEDVVIALSLLRRRSSPVTS